MVRIYFLSFSFYRFGWVFELTSLFDLEICEQMKKVLFSLILITSAHAWADMDSYCQTDWNKLYSHIVFIRENCERNNILYMRDIPDKNTSRVIAEFCRHDRQINVSGNLENKELVCVLYDNEARINLSDKVRQN